MPTLTFEFARNRRALMLGLIYGSIMAASFYLSYEVRFDFLVPESYQQDRLHFLPAAVCIKLVALVLVGQFGSMLNYFSVPDLFRMIWAMTGSSAILLSLRFLGAGFSVPRGVLLTDFKCRLPGCALASTRGRCRRALCGRTCSGPRVIRWRW